jgi:hypothetical protein
VFVRYPPGRIRHEGDQPVALLGVRVPASRFRLVDLPLGMPTTSARTSRGTWALYPLGAEVVVVHPDGAVSGPPVEVAAEVARLAADRDLRPMPVVRDVAGSAVYPTAHRYRPARSARRSRAGAGP